MIYLFLDILIYNYTSYKTFFFLLNINNINYIKVLSIGIILDYFILNTYFLNVLLLTTLYILRKYIFKNTINHFPYYLLFNIFCLLLYYLITNIVFNYLNIRLIISILIINTISIIISYIKYHKSICLIGEY